MSQSMTPSEIIICDAQSTDETVKVAESYGALTLSSAANRSLQRNIGCLHSTSEFVLFIDSDMELTERVIEECLNKMSPNVAGIVIPEIDIGTSYWSRVKGFERSFYKTAWWLQAARFYKKDFFIKSGGFDIGLVATEDWDLDERMKKFGEIETISSVIKHNEAELTLKKVLKKKSHYSASFDNFSSRHPERAKKCFSIVNRLRLIIAKPIRLARSPLLVGGLIVLGLSEALIATGLLQLKAVNTNEKPLDQTFNPIRERQFE
jgi:glycosyltransferase involved in cell wall biosynthesis